jgi:hypothetical protein
MYLDLSGEAKQLRLLFNINRMDDSLYDVAHFDARVQEFYAKPELPSRRRAQTMRAFGGQLAVYHSALPFNEPERQWLGEVFTLAGTDLTRKYPGERNYAPGMKLLSEISTELIVAGVRQTVEGGELRERWLAWQHQTGQYEAQGTRGLARTALGAIAETLNPRRAERYRS